MDAQIQARLAAEWLDAARAEHAAIASFARLTLHLLGVAAPPDLLRDSNQAGIDEVEHARRCFALAARYGGQALGPGPFPLDGDPLGPLDLPSITRAAVIEGCVGETLSALEAAEAAALATDPEAKAALELITEDETRHAELSWRVVRWALSLGDPQTRAAAIEGFEAAPRWGGAPPEPDPDEAQLNAHGRLSEPQRYALQQQGWPELIEPARQALFALEFSP
ncbi:hypothetical protein KKB55_22980 [Myxococcota bacterium]|nr:hypothetical protein [Myxococcota bacterium]MBU1900620.1 hypothetical protein [Myxococcota bacterium]